MVRSVQEYVQNESRLAFTNRLVKALSAAGIRLTDISTPRTEYVCDCLDWAARQAPRLQSMLVNAAALDKRLIDLTDDERRRTFESAAKDLAMNVIEDVAKAVTPHPVDGKTGIVTDFVTAVYVPCEKPWDLAAVYQEEPCLMAKLQDAERERTRMSQQARRQYFVKLKHDTEALIGPGAENPKLRNKNLRDLYLNTVGDILGVAYYEEGANPFSKNRRTAPQKD